jgi:hypothetical protein
LGGTLLIPRLRPRRRDGTGPKTTGVGARSIRVAQRLDGAGVSVLVEDMAGLLEDAWVPPPQEATHGGGAQHSAQPEMDSTQADRTHGDFEFEKPGEQDEDPDEEQVPGLGMKVGECEEGGGPASNPRRTWMPLYANVLARSGSAEPAASMPRNRVAARVEGVRSGAPASTSPTK